jgi:L-amino acid N-acyltransferase YncA
MKLIREARPDDIDAILRIGVECHAEAATKFAVDRVQARRIIAQFVQSPRYFAWVAEADDEVLGCLLGGIAQVWYSQQKEASDLLFYVRPDPRVIGAGKLMLKRFMRWGYERGADGFSMAVSFGGPKAVNTGKIYRKLGFSEVGSVFYLQDQLPEKKQ